VTVHYASQIDDVLAVALPLLTPRTKVQQRSPDVAVIAAA